MKRRMSLITAFVVLPFLISLSAVSTSFAKTASQTTPTTKQQAQPTQTSLLPKSAFWDLAPDHCVINGEFVQMNPCSYPSINVKVGQPVTFMCYYKVKTLPVANITSADAKYWGSGNFRYRITCQVVRQPQIIKETKATRSLPKFTWEDVKKWQQTIKSPGCKTWTEQMVFTWTPAQLDTLGLIVFAFKLDVDNVIKETDDYAEHNMGGAKLIVNP